MFDNGSVSGIGIAAGCNPVASAFLVRVQGGPLNTHFGDVSRQQSKIKQIIKPEGANNRLSSETRYLGGRVNRHMCQ